MTTKDTTTNDVYTLEDIATADGTRYKVVPTHGGQWRIGTLSTAHVIDWMEKRKDPNGKVDASMFLIARSLVFGTEPKNYTRVPDELVVEVMEQFKAKDDTDNGKLVDAILDLNDMIKKKGADAGAERKNDSGEAISDASPSV
jgi:hypothetical protein